MTAISVLIGIHSRASQTMCVDLVENTAGLSPRFWARRKGAYLAALASDVRTGIPETDTTPRPGVLRTDPTTRVGHTMGK